MWTATLNLPIFRSSLGSNYWKIMTVLEMMTFAVAFSSSQTGISMGKGDKVAVGALAGSL
jgi:hypothetical protein